MNLNPHPVYPSAGRYVLRLQRDAMQAGLIAGRIEHVTSGEGIEFANRYELNDWLARHCVQAAADLPREI